MPEESAAALLVPTAKSRATDFSIAAIMARDSSSPEPCARSPATPERLASDGQYNPTTSNSATSSKSISTKSKVSNLLLSCSTGRYSRLSSPSLDAPEDDDIEVDVEECSDGEHSSVRQGKHKSRQASPPMSDCGSDAADIDRESPDLVPVTKSTKNKIFCNCDELLSVECHLETKDLWDKFHDLGTEMIITKTGR